ncbi:hypothetical protein FD755_009982, partial [Muntiacus reevesi]
NRPSCLPPEKSVCRLLSHPGGHITLSSVLRAVQQVFSVEGEHHEKAVELLKAAKDSVKLVVRYTPKVLEEMEARFEKLRTARRRQQQQFLVSLKSIVS